MTEKEITMKCVHPTIRVVNNKAAAVFCTLCGKKWYD